MSTYVKAKPTEHESATAALVQRLGAHASIEIVSWREAFVRAPSEPVIRIGQNSDVRVSQGAGGRDGQGGLDVAEVKVVSYGTGAPNFRNALINGGRVEVLDRYRSVLEGVDIYELQVGKTVPGRVGPLSASAAHITLATLPSTPVLGGSDVQSMANTIVGELRHRVRGELLVDAELVSASSTIGEPNDDGVAERSVKLVAKVGVVPTTSGPRMTLGFAWDRTEVVLRGLVGRGFPYAGRVTGVEIVSHETSKGGTYIDVAVALTLRGRIGGVR